MMEISTLKQYTIDLLAHKAIIGVQIHLGLGAFARKFDPNDYHVFQWVSNELVRVYLDDERECSLQVEFGEWPTTFVDFSSLAVLVRPERLYDFNLEMIDYQVSDMGPQRLEVDLSSEEGNIAMYESMERRFDRNKLQRHRKPRVVGLSTSGQY